MTIASDLRPHGTYCPLPEPVGNAATCDPWTDHPAEDPNATLECEALGWRYYTRVDHEDDHDGTQKLGHYAVHGDRVVEMDFTPYATMTREVFAMVVRLGFLKRSGPCPLQHADVLAAYHRQRSHALYEIEIAMSLYASLDADAPHGALLDFLEAARRYPLPAAIEPDAHLLFGAVGG